MKLAFLILAHKNPVQLLKLTDYLVKNDCAVLIHIDKKAKEDFNELKLKYAENRNVKIYSEFKVYWGSYNQIQATVFLLDEAIKNFSFDYVSLISGQDLPLRPIPEFRQFLERSNGRDFTSIFKVEKDNPWSDNNGLDRMRLYWITDFSRFKFFFNKLNGIIHKAQQALNWYRPINIELYGGTNWFTITRKTAELVDHYLKMNEEFLRLFKNTRMADEIVLATILMNSKCKENIENNYLRFVDWQTGPEFPRTFRICDFERLKSLQNVYFVRKFDEKTDNFIIEKFYSEILIT